jgi:hypothetical protein
MQVADDSNPSYRGPQRRSLLRKHVESAERNSNSAASEKLHTTVELNVVFAALHRPGIRQTEVALQTANRNQATSSNCVLPRNRASDTLMHKAIS